MRTSVQCLPAFAASSAGVRLFNVLGHSIPDRLCRFYSAAVPNAVENASTISSSQLTLLNYLGTLPSVARKWDSRTVEAELRNVDAANCTELELSRSEPTAVQHALAKRHGVVLPAGASRLAAAATLATVLPPSICSLAVLYGVLEYDGDAPASDAAARQLIRSATNARPHGHPLDADLSPVASSQVNELFNRLGYIGRLPYSYGSAQLMAACLRTILADVDDEARLRPLPSHDARQADLIHYLRSRRAPPGSTRGMPAVLDLDLAAKPPVNRLAAARNILQLLQNHELCASPVGRAVEALRNLGHAGPVPPTTGEALMLATELRDRCLRPKAAHFAALRAAGYGAGGGAQPVPYPDSMAHFKAVLRVLRRGDNEASMPATRTALRQLAELRRCTPAAAAVAPWGGATGRGRPLGPCPSQFEVRAAVEDLPLSELMLERLLDLGWPGPMPTTLGSALALEDFLLNQKSFAANVANANAAVTPTPDRHAHFTAAPSPPLPLSYTDVAAVRDSNLGSQLDRHGQLYGAHQHHHPNGTTFDRYQRRQQFVSRLGLSPEETLIKIQIRGMFPGAVSEWHLPTMPYDEAEHVLGCLMTARRVVLERVSGTAYDEYVDRWSEAESEGEWWVMEWLWH